MVDKSLLNVCLLGLSFMLIFTAFHTMGSIQKIILSSIQRDDPSFDGKANYSLALIHVFFPVFIWTAPSVISRIGSKYSMIIGATAYLVYMLSFLFPKRWLMYACSTFLGIGAGILWTGQGNYLILNSTKKHISRNSGIFWAMFQLSMLLGSTFVYFVFKGQEHVNVTIRTIVIGTLSSILDLGVVVLLILPRATKEKEENEEDVQEKPVGPWQAFVGTTKLFFTKSMLLLSLTFLYTGLVLGFFSIVYGSCIGFTRELKNLVGVSGIFIGLGEVLGGSLIGIFGDKTVKWGRGPVILAGFIVHACCFFLIFLNLPNQSPFHETNNAAFIPSNSILAIFCSFLLGLGDSLYNTQIYSLLGTMYADRSAPAFAIFKFAQSVGAAISFLYAESIGLYWQLGILLVTSTIGSFTFITVEFLSKISKP